MGVDAVVVGGSFDGLSLAPRRLVLATGVVDELPDLPGLAKRWGRSEFMETTVAGVFAFGDASRPVGNVATAVSNGAIAGAFAHRSLSAGL